MVVKVSNMTEIISQKDNLSNQGGTCIIWSVDKWIDANGFTLAEERK